MAREEGKQCTTMPGHFPRCRHETASGVHQRVLALNCGHRTCQKFKTKQTKQKKALYSLLHRTASDQGWIGAHFAGNEVLRVLSLCGWLAWLCLRLLFDSDGAPSGAALLGGAGFGAQGTEWVVAGTTEAVVQGGGGECSRLVIPAEGARAEVTERRGRGAANAAVVPRTFPAPIWGFGEVETQQVIRFWAVLPVTHHQLSSFSAAEAEVLVCVFALWPQLPFLLLQLSILGLLLFLHHCSARWLDPKESRTVF